MAETTSEKSGFGRFMRSPWSVLASVVVAIAVGLLSKRAAAELAPFGRFYGAILEIAALPILASALVTGAAGLARSSGVGRLVVRTLLTLVVMLVLVSIVGTGAGLLGTIVGGGPAAGSASIGAAASPKALAPPIAARAAGGALTVYGAVEGAVRFLTRLAPPIAPIAGLLLIIAFVAILFGAAAGRTGDRRAENLITFFDGMLAVSQKLVSWLIVLLPIALVCLLAAPVASIRAGELRTLAQFLAVLYGAGVVIMLVDVIIIWRRSREGFAGVLRSVLDPLAVSFASRSVYTAYPVGLERLVHSLGFYERSSNLVFTFSALVGRFGNMLYYPIAALFVAKLSGVAMDPLHLVLVVALSLLAGAATISGRGLLGPSILPVLLIPLGLSVQAAGVLLASEFAAAPLRSAVEAITAMCANSLIVPTVDPLNRRKRGSRTRAEQVTESADFLTRVRERGHLVVAMERRDLPPFYLRTRDGDTVGIGIDVVRSIASAIGVEATFDHSMEGPAQLITKVKEDEVDLAILSPNFHRIYENELAYSSPYLQSREAMLIDRKALSEIRSHGEDMRAAFRRFTGSVALISSPLYAKIAERMFPKCKGVEYRKLEEIADAVLDGEVVAAFGTEVELKAALARRQSGAERVVCIVYNNLEIDLRLAVAPKYSEGMKVLNESIASRRVTASADEIANRYRD